jgi:hypothetical protein
MTEHRRLPSILAVVAASPDRCKIHKPIDAGERDFLLPSTKKAPDIPWFPERPAAGHSCNNPFQIRFARNNSIVSVTYMSHQNDAARPGRRDRAAANLAAFSSAFGSLAAAVCGICNLNSLSR